MSNPSIDTEDTTNTTTETKPDVKLPVTDSEMSTEDMNQFWKTLEKMKINPQKFMHWAVNHDEEKHSVKESMTTFKEPMAAASPLASGYYKAPLRISTFSGDGKSDSSYDLWKYEVTCLMKESQSEEALLQAIRRSVKGEAAKVIMRLGVGASVEEILFKLDSIYGNVLEKEDILAEFYCAKQREDETCSAWSCRLEEILCTALRLGKVQNYSVNEMLRTMFYKGLRQELKDVCGHLYHTISDFDRLRVEIRKIESERTVQIKSSKGKQGTVKAAISSKTDSSDDDKLKDLQAQINQLKAMQQPYYMPPAQKPYGNKGKQSFQKGKKGKHSNKGYSYPMPEARSTAACPDDQQSSHRSDQIICYRCGQEGHIAIGCRVRVDHKKDLNFRLPNPGDKGLAEGRTVPPTYQRN